MFPLRVFVRGCVYLTDFAGGNFYSVDDRKRDRAIFIYRNEIS